MSRPFRRLLILAAMAVGFCAAAARACYGQDELAELRNVLQQQGMQIEQLQQQLQAQTLPPPPATSLDPSLDDDGFAEVGKDLGMTAQWRHGLHLETKDKAFRIHPTGRLQVDGVWMTGEDNVEFGPNGVGDVLDGVAFRRFRVGVEGTFWEICNFHFEPDLLNTVNSLAPNGTKRTR